jgi:hypothetical protein
MKYFSIIFLLFVTFSCQDAQHNTGHQKTAQTLPSTGTFGKEVSYDQAIAADQVAGLFNASDTVAVRVFGHISASCKHTGCWMDFDLGNNNALHVTFIDESFTIPLDAAGKNAVAEGIAIRELIPVEKLQNYAREDGKSEAEIAAITEPTYAYEFIANGVLIEE